MDLIGLSPAAAYAKIESATKTVAPTADLLQHLLGLPVLGLRRRDGPGHPGQDLEPGPTQYVEACKTFLVASN